MIGIEIDNIRFEVYGDRVLWSPSETGDFVPAPEDYARLARALVLSDWQDRDGHTYVADSLLLASLDEAGWLHPSVSSGLPRWARPARALTGRFQGQRVVSVLEWDDPLDAVMTTREVEETLGVKNDTVNDAIRNRWITGRKSGDRWLVRRAEAVERWG